MLACKLWLGILGIVPLSGLLYLGLGSTISGPGTMWTSGICSLSPHSNALCMSAHEKLASMVLRWVLHDVSLLDAGDKFLAVIGSCLVAG